MKTEIKTKGMERFTQVSNRAVRDDSLGAVSLAIYTYIRSHNTSCFKIYKKNVESRFKEIGRVSFNRAWKDLIEKGWLESRRVKGEDGRYTSWEHWVLVENDSYKLLDNGKSIRVTDLQDTDMHLDDSHNHESHEYAGLNKTNSKNTNIKNTNIKNNVSNDTLSEFESFWKAISTVYKKYSFNTGSKQEALKVFKKMKVLNVEELIKQTDIRLANKRRLLDSKQFAPNPKNVSGWLRYRGWEDNLDLVTNSAANSGAYPPPTFRAAPPTRVIRDL